MYYFGCFPISYIYNYTTIDFVLCSVVATQQKSEVERCLQEKERELVEAAVRHQEELDRLRAETAVQKQNYEKKIDEKEAALRGKERELEMVQQSLQRGHSEKEGEVTELRTNLRRTSSQLQQKESEM